MTKKLTTEEFISRARRVHGDCYEYDGVNYKNAKEKITIICKKHGKFKQIPDSHLSGRGCSDCGILRRTESRKSSTEQFIKKAEEIHGDCYDYSKVDYINNRTKVIIICNEHGEFEQKPYSHLSGTGCHECGVTKSTESRRPSTEQFIKKAEEIHGDCYDYSKVDYKGNGRKVIIICEEHGDFQQTPHNHLMGQGCAGCSGNKKSSTEQFIKKAEEIHGDCYDYSKVDYKSTHQKIIIICNEHGDFQQTPSSHLNGQGCHECAGNKKSSTEQFIKKAEEIHGDCYDYSKVDYINNRTKVIIICNEHGEFEQTPNSHLCGCGCHECAGYGFDISKPAILYFLSLIDGSNLFKVGITNRIVETRFHKQDLEKIKKQGIIKFRKGNNALNYEQKILKHFQNFRPQSKLNILKNGGNTELLTEDIFELMGKPKYRKDIDLYLRSN